MKKVLIINGHPDKHSFCNALTEAYVRGCVATGNTADVLHVRLLNFEMNLENGYSRKIELEADVVLSQKKITEADHIVIIHPVWWGSVPALLKGFFDRVLLPGFAFRYREHSVLWDKLLAGKSGHVIYTSDTPIWLYTLFFRAPSVNMVKRRVLQFCGISPVKVTGIGPLRTSTKQSREEWLNKVEKLAKKIN